MSVVTCAALYPRQDTGRKLQWKRYKIWYGSRSSKRALFSPRINSADVTGHGWGVDDADFRTRGGCQDRVRVQELCFRSKPETGYLASRLNFLTTPATPCALLLNQRIHHSPLIKQTFPGNFCERYRAVCAHQSLLPVSFSRLALKRSEDDLIDVVLPPR